MKASVKGLIHHYRRATPPYSAKFGEMCDCLSLSIRLSLYPLPLLGLDFLDLRENELETMQLPFYGAA